MSYRKRIIKPEEVVQPGQSIAVVIKEIDVPNRRISLSIRDAQGDPWIEVPERFHIGQAVEGVLEKKEKFGYFVCLAPGVTGLLPKSKILRAPQSAAFERLREGDGLMVVIEQIGFQERKITLRPGDAREAADWHKYAAKQKASMSSLGEKLQAALASQKKKR
jgi:small subunit ribosomal protein S1